MRVKIIVPLLFLFTSLSFSQKYVVTGTVVDKNNSAIAYTNVTLISSKNSNYLQGAVSNEEGAFKINFVEKGLYEVKISFLGFQDYVKEINIVDNVNLGTVVIKENLQELDGVILVAKRPTIKRTVDRLIFNVENSTLSNNNVLDVLKHTPGVLVYDSKIIIKQASPVIYINDRRIHLSSNEVLQLLEGTSASNIKSIEVITSPPAKYEAEGAAVINIITSKNIIAGYNGSVFGTYKQGSEFPKYAFGTNHFFKTKKWNTYLNYSVSPRRDFRNNDEFINFIRNDEVISTWETDFRRTRETLNQNINANVDFELNKNNSFGLSSNMLIAPEANTKTNINSETLVFNNAKLLDSSFTTNNKKVDETVNLALTLDYIHKFKKEGEKLLVSAHHTNFNFSSFQDVDTDYLFPNKDLIRNNRFQTTSSQQIKLYTGQIDYELPLNEGGLFEAGTKISNINSMSILGQFNLEDGTIEADLLNSDRFYYDESNYALYSSIAKEWSSWSFKLGLRAEFTETRGVSVTNNSTDTSDYIKFFPSLNVLYALNDKNDIYFNYNKRIFRPRYNQLNPFKYFLNDNAFITGDPGLLPQIDNVFIIGYTFNEKYTLEAFYRYEDDPAIEIIFQDNDENLLKYINTNIDRSMTYGLDFTTFTPIIKNWDFYVLSSVYYYDNQFFAIESDNQLTNTGQWSFYGQVVNYLSFLENRSLTAEVSFIYISAFVDGPGTISGRSGFDVNIRKTIWNNKASFSVGINDAFNQMNFNQTTQYLNQDFAIDSRLENRLITFGFNYKFGNYNLENNKKDVELNERDRLQ